jgi:hypothetical protein
MPFIITFEPLNRIQGVKPTTVSKETAAEAWAEVQCLMASDERVTINNGTMGWQELRMLAQKESH